MRISILFLFFYSAFANAYFISETSPFLQEDTNGENKVEENISTDMVRSDTKIEMTGSTQDDHTEFNCPFCSIILDSKMAHENHFQVSHNIRMETFAQNTEFRKFLSDCLMHNHKNV